MTSLVRVLIVDDDRGWRTTVREAVHYFPCAVTEASSRDEAIALLTSQDFDVIFLDIVLSKANKETGFQVLEAAQAAGRPLGKVIVMTGLLDADVKARALKLGAFGFLNKLRMEILAWREAFAAAITAQTGASHEALAAVPATLKVAASRRRRPPARARRRGAPRLLLLDDDVDFLELAQAQLAGEFDVLSTNKVEPACRFVREQKFDLVVLDVTLKEKNGVSGLDVLERMRKTRPRLRAIILTGDPTIPLAVESVRRGALDYVSKADLKALPGKIFKQLQKEDPVRVFLSYARPDYKFVATLFRNLSEEGFFPWMDKKSIPPGLRWEPAIKKEIRETDYFVYCLSEESAEREGVIRKEVSWALDREREMPKDMAFFLTLRAKEDIELDEEIEKFQCIDRSDRNWFERLVGALARRKKRRTRE